MNDPENFLARWSRRKREIAAAEAAPGEAIPGGPDAVAPDTPATSPSELEAEMAALAAPEEQPAAPAPVFDPASLPTLDSIGADTDIRGFLAPGVPTELAHAALRRVWTADPGIRDFKGLAEYDWDFTAPGSMFGFGELDSGTDVKQMLADVFGELSSDPAAPAGNIVTEAPSPAASDADQSALSEREAPEPEKMTDETSVDPEKVGEQSQEDDLVHRNVNAATQSNISVIDEEQRIPRRQHGGALPQ
jgi:hypothetical protein